MLKDVFGEQKPQSKSDSKMTRAKSKQEVVMGVVEFADVPDNETTLLQRSRSGFLDSDRNTQDKLKKPVIFNNYGKLQVSPKKKV